MSCCTTCERPASFNVLGCVIDISTRSNPMSMVELEEKLEELRSLFGHVSPVPKDEIFTGLLPLTRLHQESNPRRIA